MNRGRGPLCVSQVGSDWIDSGTMARTRHLAPADRHATHCDIGTRVLHKLSKRELEFLSALRTGGVEDASEQAMFLAQMAHESSGFRRMREDLNYTASRLMAVFPGSFPTLQAAEEVVGQGAPAIAERIYGGRTELGNVQQGDGARFIGRGYVHLTGRANYAAAGAALGLDLLGHPELAEEQAIATRIAIWFWRKHGARLSSAAQQGDVRTVTRIINGGLNGLSDRRARYDYYHSLLVPFRPSSSRSGF